LTPVRSTAIAGTLVLSTLSLAALARQTSQSPSASPRPGPAASSPASVQSADEAKPAQPVSVKPRNFTALLPALPFNRTTVVIDPAHGGADNGSRISDETVEKNVTLALALRLRSLLTARGFNVVMTRDSDDANEKTAPFSPLTLDDRAGLANHERGGACLLLHATGSGTGVHLYSSELAPAAGESAVGPWLTAQAAWVSQSQMLAEEMSRALTRSQLPELNGAASVRPLDSLTCPALIVELAPREDDPDSINDEDYQQHVAQAIAGALVVWKDVARPPSRLAPETPSPGDGSEP
jgi:N-acetylmuramoyl-L-alanine amidase